MITSKMDDLHRGQSNNRPDNLDGWLPVNPHLAPKILLHLIDCGSSIDHFSRLLHLPTKQAIGASTRASRTSAKQIVYRIGSQYQEYVPNWL